MRTIIAWLLLSVTCLAQTTAIIDGPAMAMPGELVVLNSSRSVGDNHKWIAPDALSTAQAGCTGVSSQLFFATPRQGTYEFLLIVTDKQASIEVAKHIVVIKQLTAPEPPPTDPPKPPITPPSKFDALQDLSKTNSVRLSDSATRSALATNLRSAVNSLSKQCEAGTCPTVQGAQAIVQKTIEDTLLARARTSRNADWLNGWRVPNNQLMSQLGINTVALYLSAIDAITKGLE